MSWPTCRWKPQAADQQGTVLGVSWGRWGFWIPWIYSCMPCMHRYLNLWWTEWSPLPWISSFWGVAFHLLRWLLHCVLCIRRFKHSHKPPTLQRRRLHPACAMGAAPLYSQTGPNLLNQPIAVAFNHFRVSTSSNPDIFRPRATSLQSFKGFPTSPFPKGFWTSLSSLSPWSCRVLEAAGAGGVKRMKIDELSGRRSGRGAHVFEATQQDDCT